MTIVVVISGMSGSGKTTLIKALLDRFKGTNCRFISLDDYSSSNHWYPDWLSFGGDRLFAVRKWRDAGCDPDKVVDTPELKEDLVNIKARGDLDYVFLEEPFGTKRKEIAPLVDLNIHIETPLDIALAREAIRISSNGVNAVDYLQRYIDADLRALFIAQGQAGDKVGLIVDGTGTISTIANKAADFIRSKNK